MATTQRRSEQSGFVYPWYVAELMFVCEYALILDAATSDGLCDVYSSRSSSFRYGGSVSSRDSWHSCNTRSYGRSHRIFVYQAGMLLIKHIWI